VDRGAASRTRSARITVGTLDEGEAALIELAVERAIETVCVDE